MKNKSKKEYNKASEYFTDDHVLLDEVEALEKQKKFVNWVQEFSKKIVVMVFILYLISMFFSLILVYYSFKQGSISGIDTLITEINQTFRDVIGGYIIKAGVENAFKIAGNYFIGIYDAKLKAVKSKLIKDGVEGIDMDSPSEDFSDDEFDQ